MCERGYRMLAVREDVCEKGGVAVSQRGEERGHLVGGSGRVVEETVREEAREVGAGAEEAVEGGHGEVGGDLEKELVGRAGQRHGGGRRGRRRGRRKAGAEEMTSECCVISCTAVDGNGSPTAIAAV